MDTKRLAKKTRFSILANTMSVLGLNPDEVYDSMEAIKAIYDELKVRDQALEFVCDRCGADVPDVDDCPICGASFGEGVGQNYIGARRGRRPRRYHGITGMGLFRLFLNALEISRRYVKWKKTVVSLWSKDGHGMLARCFIGAYSVRVQLPYGPERFEGYKSKVFDYPRPIKNMVSRIYLESKSDVDGVVSILKQTEIIKANTVRRKNRKKPIQPITETKPELVRRPKRRIVDDSIPDFSGLE